MEVWKTYRRENWPPQVFFEVSNTGRIKNMRTGRYKKLTKTNKYGQLGFSVYLGKDDTGKDRTTTAILHRVLAICFIENPENKPYVIHKDHNITNNEIDNLLWASEKEWVAHVAKSPRIKAEKERRKKIGFRGYQKLTEAQAYVLKKKLLDPNRKTRIRVLAKQFGVSEMQLYRIKSGENWGSLEV